MKTEDRNFSNKKQLKLSINNMNEREHIYKYIFIKLKKTVFFKSLKEEKNMKHVYKHKHKIISKL